MPTDRACTCGKTTAAPCSCTDPWPAATAAVPEIKHLSPEPMVSRERTLHYWLARLTSYPRRVSIGSIDSHAELPPISREDYETIQAVLRGK